MKILLPLALLLVGCASAPPPVLLRAPGSASYRLTVESDEGRGPQTLVAEFELVTAADGKETIALQRVVRGSEELALDPALARIEVPQDEHAPVAALVPPGVSEPVFGAVTDALTFVLVQTRGFGADRLAKAGDARRFDAFSESWSRPPGTIAARIDCPGGTLALESVAEDAALLRWEPDPMHLAIVRDVPAAGGRVLLAGVETLVLEVRCDPATGALLGGRSRRDELAMRLFMGAAFGSDAAPAATEVPSEGGMPLTIRRTLVLERLAG
jgi:hypothetical protein